MVEQQQPTPAEFKPNIYPIMYWALAYGVLAGVLLFVVFLLSRIITLVWFPVFIVGLVYGAFRNYRRQRGEWDQSQGTPSPARPVTQELREAVADIAVASQEMMAEQSPAEAEEFDQDVSGASESEETLDQNQPPAAPPPPPV